MAERQQIYTNIENCPTFYINSVQLAQSQFDVRLRMGVIEEADDEKIVTRVYATMFMTIQHAKVLAAMLTRHVEKHERLNGPIETPVLTDSENSSDKKE